MVRQTLLLQLSGLHLDHEDFLPHVTSIKQGKKLHLLDILFLAYFCSVSLRPF